MLVKTALWGTKEIQAEQIYLFPKGLPGFEDERQFALLPIEETPFLHLQSLRHKELSFVMMDPFQINRDYEFELPESDKADLELGSDVMVYCIVTLHSEVVKSTANLLAPVVFNPAAQKAKQVVLHQGGYLTRTPIFADSSADAEADSKGEK